MTMTYFSWHHSYSNEIKEAALKATNCTNEVLTYIPSCIDLINILGLNGWLLLGLSTAAFLITNLMFVANFVHVFRNVHSKYSFSTALVLSVYPGLSLCMYLEVLFPKANNVLDAAAQLWFVVCMYQFFRLTISYFGGETAFVESMSGSVLPWRNVPCCFWPCVWPCLPKAPVTKKQVRFLRILIIQHPFVQAIFTIIGLTFYIEDWFIPKQISANNSYIYLYVITTVSFCFALWAFAICFKSSRTRLQQFSYFGKIASFQLSLVFLRLQSLLFNLVLVPAGVIPCVPPLSPHVFANTILSSLLLGELVVLSVMANHFFRMSIADRKDFVPPVRRISRGSQCDLLPNDSCTLKTNGVFKEHYHTFEPTSLMKN